MKFLKIQRPKLFLLILVCNVLSIKAQDWMVTEVAALPEKVANNAVCEGFIGDTPYLYSFGGIDSTKEHSGIHLRSFRYNTITNEVETIPDLPDNLGKIAAGASRIGNIIYIIGGYHVYSNGTEISSAKVHRYDILNNTYLEDGAPIPIAIDDHVQAVWRDSLIYVVTGWSNNTNRREVQIYNPSNDTWSVGTSTPNSNSYKSFGASGAIIGDTIYYYGGASLSGAFNIQNQLRKGVINPDDPTAITWSFSVPDTQMKGYRMAATTVFDQVHWIGGSAVTYNFDGIAYNGSGGVPPVNRAIYWDVNQTEYWQQSFLNEFPMDLRGIASINDTLKFLAGGMLSGQAVTNKIYKLEWDNSIVETQEVNIAKTIVELYPNPVIGNDLFITIAEQYSSEPSRLEVFNAQGQLVLTEKYETISKTLAVSMQNLPKGSYVVKLTIGKEQLVEKIVKQ